MSKSLSARVTYLLTSSAETEYEGTWSSKCQKAGYHDDMSSTSPTRNLKKSMCAYIIHEGNLP